MKTTFPAQKRDRFATERTQIQEIDKFRPLDRLLKPVAADIALKQSSSIKGRRQEEEAVAKHGYNVAVPNFFLTCHAQEICVSPTWGSAFPACPQISARSTYT
jgi:hypothetical protein